MIEIDNTSGRKWARGTLVLTLLVSIVANVTHAVLAASEISLWLRVPNGIIWPALTFLAIEIVVRIIWQSRFSHYLARTMILGPAVPAVVISYSHQQDLLIMMGENALVSNIGPLAIDGLMIGCTLALLFTTARIAAAEPLAPVELAEPAPAAPEPIPAVAVVEDAPVVAPALAPALETPEPLPAIEGGQEALGKAIEALKGGASTADAREASGLSAPTVRRYAAVVRALRQDPHAAIDARKLGVRPSAVNEIRAWARMESVR